MDTVFHIDSLEGFQTTIEEVIRSYCNYDNLLPQTRETATLKPAKEDIKHLLLDCNFDTNKVLETLANKGWNKERITFFVELLNNKKTELLYASLINHNSEYGVTITNFDWILKDVLGTSEFNALKYPLLQLVFSTVSNRDEKILSYDINKDMLLKLINTLETLDDI